jgi:hypothetical protein
MATSRRFFISRPSQGLRTDVRFVLAVAFTTCVTRLGQAQTLANDTHIWINPGFYSAHFDANKGLRNSNPGLGVEIGLNNDWSFTLGKFTNSNDAESNYLGFYFQPWHAGEWKTGFVGGAFNGYPNAFNGGWFPALLPVATFERQRIGLNIALIPPLQDRLYGAISFQLKWQIAN